MSPTGPTGKVSSTDNRFRPIGTRAWYSLGFVTTFIVVPSRPTGAIQLPDVTEDIPPAVDAATSPASDCTPTDGTNFSENERLPALDYAKGSRPIEESVTTTKNPLAGAEHSIDRQTAANDEDAPLTTDLDADLKTRWRTLHTSRKNRTELETTENADVARAIRPAKSTVKRQATEVDQEVTPRLTRRLGPERTFGIVAKSAAFNGYSKTGGVM